jgi:hypothetical protein
VQEELTKRVSRRLIKRAGFERCTHMFQPGASLGGVDSETRVRFAQTQPPSGQGLAFIATEELNKKGAELVDRAPEALSRE